MSLHLLRFYVRCTKFQCTFYYFAYLPKKKGNGHLKRYDDDDFNRVIRNWLLLDFRIGLIWICVEWMPCCILQLWSFSSASIWNWNWNKAKIVLSVGLSMCACVSIVNIPHLPEYVNEIQRKKSSGFGQCNYIIFGLCHNNIMI